MGGPRRSRADSRSRLISVTASRLRPPQTWRSDAVIGDGRLFAAVTAVVVGGTALTGGEGGVVNTLMDVLIVTVLGHRMVLLGVSPYVQQTVHGLMIIAAVALSLERIRQTIVKSGARHAGGPRTV